MFCSRFILDSIFLNAGSPKAAVKSVTTSQVPDHTVYQNTENQGHDPSQQTVPQGTVFQNVNKQGQVLATETMRAMPQTWTRPSDREEEQVSAGTVYQNYVPPPPPVPPRRSEDPPPIPVKSYRAPKGAPPIPDKSYREVKKPPFTKNPPIETKMDSINQGSDFVQSEANVGVTASKSEQDSQSGVEGGDTWSFQMPSCEGQSHPPAGDGTPTEVKKGFNIWQSILQPRVGGNRGNHSYRSRSSATTSRAWTGSSISYTLPRSRL